MSRELEMSARAEHSKLAKETEKESRMAIREMQGNVDKAGIREERFELFAEGNGRPERQKPTEEVWVWLGAVQSTYNYSHSAD